MAALAGGALLADAAVAQSPLEWSVHRGELRDAGVYSLAEGRWLRRGPAATEGAGSGLLRLYDNSCLWTGSAPGVLLFNGIEACEAVYDDGRLPRFPSNDYRVEQVTFGYQTFALPGTVDVELAFYDTLGGPCAGFQAPTPPQPRARGTLRLNAASGLDLPGDPTGSGSAWIVTLALDAANEFCLLAEGDGGTGGAGGADPNFNWRFRHFNDTATTGQPGGPLIAGEPLRGVLGACTFGYPCGFDPVTGPCGTGLLTTDAFWNNVDGDPAGPAGTVNTSLQCQSAPTGTGCFFFGGWQQNPYASYLLRMAGSAGCARVTAYCTAKTTSTGCVPFMSASGVPSVTSTVPFRVRASDHLPYEAGLLLYGFAKANLGFHGGKLCVRSPLRANPVKFAKQDICVNPAGSCTSPLCGTLFQDFNKTIQSGSSPLLTTGQFVTTQWLQRDPADPRGFGDNLSDALRFQIAP